MVCVCVCVCLCVCASDMKHLTVKAHTGGLRELWGQSERERDGDIVR